MSRVRMLALCVLAPLAAGGCDYVRLLRPSVVRQLTPELVQLVNEFPAVDNPNEDVVARLIGHGGLAHARPGADGVMRARVRAPKHQYIWEPSIILMPRGGELELEFHNEDHSPHAVLAASNGERMVLPLPVGTAGTVRVRLDQPGLYTFTCPVANHGPRGMVGLVLVRGDVPASARLDRPPQRRPR